MGVFYEVGVAEGVAEEGTGGGEHGGVEGGDDAVGADDVDVGHGVVVVEVGEAVEDEVGVAGAVDVGHDDVDNWITLY